MQTWLTAPRCFVDQELLVPGKVELSREEGRHLVRARRVGQNDRVCVLNGRGLSGQGPVTLTGRENVTVDIEEVTPHPKIRPHIVLCVGALKQSAWDELLKHAVELGVNRIFRLQSERSVSELKSEKEARKRHRWRDCMIEACKQSGNPWLPELCLLGSVAEALVKLPEGTFQLLAGLEGEPRGLSEVLPETCPEAMGLWIGPEGDFTPGEVQQILQAGAYPVTLGDRILRAETAALAFVSRLRLL